MKVFPSLTRRGIIARLIIYPILLFVLLAIIPLYFYSHPPRHSPDITPAQYSCQYEVISFKSSDGVNLQGWLIPRFIREDESLKPRAIITLCHGYGASKADLLDIAAALAQAGFHILLFDFRRHGESSGSISSIGYLEQLDLQAAINYIKGQKGLRGLKIGVYGFSMGAAVAIMTASSSSEIKAIVADSSYTNLEIMAIRTFGSQYHLPSFPFIQLTRALYRAYFGISLAESSPLEKIKLLKGIPVFVINGGKDPRVTLENAHQLFTAAPGEKRIWIVPQASHGETYLLAGKEYERALIGFFKKYLMKE